MLIFSEHSGYSEGSPAVHKAINMVHQNRTSDVGGGVTTLLAVCLVGALAIWLCKQQDC